MPTCLTLTTVSWSGSVFLMNTQCGSRVISCCISVFLPPAAGLKEPREKRPNTRLTPGRTGVPIVEKPRTKPRSYTTLQPQEERTQALAAHVQDVSLHGR